MPWSPPYQPTELVARLFQVIGNIRLGLGVRGSKEHALGHLMLRVWTYLGRLHQEVERLVTAAREGRLAPPRAYRPRARRQGGGTGEQKPPPANPWDGLPLPRGFGWLLRVVPETRQTGGQVQFWMEDAELAALVAKAPQLGRPLRALCYMMGIRPPAALRPPPRPSRPRRERRVPAGNGTAAQTPVSSPRASSPAPCSPPASSPPARSPHPHSPNAVDLSKRPTKAEITSWMPGPRREAWSELGFDPPRRSFSKA